ncbi:dynein axonemal assembly factor 10 [Daphnia magna]|uniref:WD repeat-containing protein 92 n=2 Tax=Daphnia magna TaxID=35525 RepID=A0A0P5U6R9_9CRUS|nr:dynein axonemal assembly factor 10 [Daphnia magna]KAK4005161.1 hypothetical protein OUZ56_006882 [Daphnia magna]KZS21817.1 WD repeat-containing protein 92 [Daphnia magna]
MTNSRILVLNEKPVNFTLFCVRWIPSSARLVVLGSHPRGTGVWQIYNLCKGVPELITEVEKPFALKCGTFAASSFENRLMATGDFNGNLNLWDLEKPNTAVYSAIAHSSIINDIDGIGGINIGKGAPELATCSRDGCVKVWDARQKDRPVAILEPEEGQSRHDCWTVAFGGAYNASERLLAAGFDNGDLKIFDLKTMKIQWETNVGNGICSVEFDRKDIEQNKLNVCTLDSRIFAFDLTTRHPTKGYAFARQKAHKSTVWSGNHLPQNRDVFMTSGGNGSLCLWQYEYPSKRSAKASDGALEGISGNLKLVQEVGVAEQPITSFSWNADKLGLAASTSFDQTLRILAVTKLNCL